MSRPSKAASLSPPQAESSKAGATRKSSCAECHRLKLRCDKEVPCASCMRRGCAAICPTGTLRSTGRGKRSVLSEVPELTAIISEMGERIRQLEKALAETHDPCEQTHLKNHPLLSHTSRQPTPTPTDQAEDGSLSVNQAGHAVYFGPIAGTEALLSIEGNTRNRSPDHERLSFSAVTESFLFRADGSSSWDTESALERLYHHLPPQPRAWALLERYFQNGCWTVMPLMQDEAVEILASVYQSHRTEPQHSLTTQQMAVVYLVFALGALVDLELPPYSPEADHYFDLACAAMSIKPFYDDVTVLTVQMLTLLASYYAHGGRRFTMDGAWSVISLASTMAQRLGMHRESFAANVGPKLAYRYRALFWETFTTEAIYGLSVGRPGTLPSNITCPFPMDEDNIAQPFCRLNRGYRQSRWRWATEVCVPIMEKFLTTTKPSYETVLNLDQKIRKHLHDAPFDNFPLEESSPSSFIQKHLVPLFTKIMLMYIHNSSFVEAMRANPEDPLLSPYAASYLAAYRSASEIIKADIKNFTTHPALFTRWWAIWKSLFNAAIIVGTVATRYPSSKIAPHAIVELFTAVDLIEKGAMSSGRAQSGLSILQRLRDKAIAVYSQFSGHNLLPPPTTTDVEATEELEIFAGYTRVVAHKVLARRQTDRRVNADEPSPTTQWNRLQLQGDADLSKLSNAGGELPWPRDFDPTIVQYFDSVDPFGNTSSGDAAMLDHEGSYEDAGFFFTPAPNAVAAAQMAFDDGNGRGWQHDNQQRADLTPIPSATVLQQMQWAQYLHNL
ncbi:Zn(2)-C6 fungal-type domain-containing protein [Mycena indigotica]|uniref:Zn(2)-C6 fungal-type domain-containing protein n=1 Tax=Mycena indigotica TaxID=2126181 RepID=A0A8H6TEC3_9AGAR|nr:Zn(2)-C6 fungal-type domain-containing protein [Mycena indigotica]KAF7315900.1 Zn(2)-C6 fungal-type domain-containing protein [Mycena indigotica]